MDQVDFLMGLGLALGEQVFVQHLVPGSAVGSTAEVLLREEVKALWEYPMVEVLPPI